MADCSNVEVRELLPDLLHPALAGEPRRVAEAHVAECEDCRDELALLRSVIAALPAAPQVDVGRIAAAIPAPRSRAVGPQSAVVDLAAQRARRRPAPFAGWRAAAAAVVVVLGVGTTRLALDDGAPVAPAVAARPADGGIAADPVGGIGAAPIGGAPMAVESITTPPRAATVRAAAGGAIALAVTDGETALTSADEVALAAFLEQGGGLPSPDDAPETLGDTGTEEF